MESKKINLILNEVYHKVSPSEKEIGLIEELVKEFLDKFSKRLKKLKIDAEIFVGGSFAKGTVIKKESYDIDIYVRFGSKYKEEKLSKLTAEILDGIGNISAIHGSRDYFKISMGPGIFVELIPVRKVNKPKDAKNITDLSYSHVNYVRKNTKNQKILRDIKLAKAFAHANGCYGAESYINGFSGYALELLVIHYGGFLKFLKAMVKADKKILIDMEKQYKTKYEIMVDMNTSKLLSPIILIDPTYKKRNALAALNDKTFKKMQLAAKKFLQNPSLRAFEKKVTDIKKIEKEAKKKKYDFLLIKAETNKQAGDIAGTKLHKFYLHMKDEFSKFFEIKKNGFEYYGDKDSNFYFVLKNRGEILINGPSIKEFNHAKAFKKKHKKAVEKKGRLYAKIRFKESAKEFFNKWKKKNANHIKEMYITELKLVKN